MWPIRASGEIEAIGSLTTESDRGAALIVGSLVDVHLEDMLKRFLRSDPPVKDAVKSTFGSYGPLSTFSGRINVALLLRLIGNRVAKELHIIRQVRNEFAHGTTAVAFSDEAISVKVKNLRLVDGYRQPIGEMQRLGQVPGMMFAEPLEDFGSFLDDPRNRYVETCSVFVCTFGASNSQTFPQVHNDDRPSWPIIEWHLPAPPATSG